MFKEMLSEKEFDFNALEKEIFRIGCEFAAGLMEQLLVRMDEHLMLNRDRQNYRHKGKHTTTLKTLMGEVPYRRTVYETKHESGSKAYVYLLDEVLNLESFGKISSNLASMIADCASDCSFRESAKKISSMTGQSISHGGAWNVIQEVGRRLSEKEERDARLSDLGKAEGDLVTPILFEEADGVWINMQGKNRPKKGHKSEMKMAVAYDGWMQKGENRHILNNKIMVSGFEDSKSFQRKKEGAIAAVFNTDEIEMRILNGDGGSWIKSGIVDSDVHYQLDPFHKNREITRKVSDKEQRKMIQKLLSDKRIEELLTYIRDISILTENETDQKKLRELYEYFKNNKEGLIPYQERGLNLPKPPKGLTYRNLGTMEHHVCDGAAKRMKHQKASWSKKGAENMARLLCNKTCGKLHDTVTSLARTVLPEHYAEMIEKVLSAGKAPKKEGKGYLYPVRGNHPFTDTFMTNGRKAILGMLGDRAASELVYR
jgi:hypothetical protein